MSFHAFLMGNNVIAYKKENKEYGMVCAWASMVDYGHITMLLGSQSVTGNNLSVGDVVGVSALSKGQKDISLLIGGAHSNEVDKFKNIAILEKNTAILIQNAKTMMVCKVEKIMKLVDENDHFIVLKILESTSDKKKEFLSLNEVLPE